MKGRRSILFHGSKSGSQILQGTIAQAAALAIFGNDILRGYSRENFWPAATVFKFCKAVRFVALSGEAAKPTESLFAEDPMQWISRLRDEGTSSLRLHHVARNDPRASDRMSVGFVGGGPRWLMETQHARASDLWEARWQVVNKDDPDKKIWDVAYCRVDQGRAHIPLQAKSLTALRQDLMMALSRIEAFATRQKLEMFAGAFRKATAILSSADPLAETYHSDLAPTPIMPLEAKQLLAAIQAAWVFGGMGSWNDLGFDGNDQQEYTALSDQLFLLLNQAISVAVNTTSGAAGP
jgi:hypothetical protein